MEYTIRKAKIDDKVFLLKLRNVTMSRYLEQVSIFLTEEENLARVESFFEDSYVIEDIQKNSIGLLKYLESKGQVELVQLQILPRCQRNGIGTNIIKSLITQSRKTNKRLTLKVLRNNPSKRLYEKVGFKIVGQDEIEYHMEHYTAERIK